MKFLLVVALTCCVLFSCKTPNAVEENALVPVDSTIQFVANIHSPWIIPLSEYWKNSKSFVLAIPDSALEMDFLVEPRFPRWEETTMDTLQGKILETQDAYTGNDCAHFDFYHVETDQNKKQGWLVNNQVYTIGSLDLGTYSMAGHELKLGTMASKIMMDEEDETCYTVTMLFLYDDSNLYLIDGSAADSDMKWINQRHLSVVNQVGVNPKASTDGDQFVIRWGEPNVSVELRIGWEGDHLRFISNTTAAMSDVDDLEVEQADGELVVEVCTLESTETGDCYYLSFSCGEFGGARLMDEIPAEDKDLWMSITINGAEGTIINPDYQNKKFEITYEWIDSEICGDPGLPPTVAPIQLIHRFRLVEAQ